jgi:hypothetical protein
MFEARAARVVRLAFTEAGTSMAIVALHFVERELRETVE